MEGELLVRTKKHENVISLQMYQFTFRRGRLHSLLPFFISFFSTIRFSPFFLFLLLSYVSPLIIIHITLLSAIKCYKREKKKKNPQFKNIFLSLIQRDSLYS